MKLNRMIYGIAALAAATLATGCEGEKDLIIYEGSLPIKTKTLYMVGDATPNGWSIDAPTELTATEEDPLVFTWEGNLVKGEMKLCLIKGSWDAGFIRPLVNGAEIGKTDLTDETFQMHAGDPDEKWKVTEAGTYSLKFDLRNWTMSTTFLRAADAPVLTPIETDVCYLVGEATEAGWNIDAPVPMEKKSTYVFEYEGPLTAGDFKACLATGDWGVSFIRPETDGCKLGKDGFESDTFLFVANPDNKWKVTDPGIYHLTFDLEHYTVKAEFKEELAATEKTPIETETLFMIGDATPGGWGMDDATAFTVSVSDPYVWTWEGELVEGEMKACLVQDGTFSCPFLRPLTNGCLINENGVESPDFVFTGSPDDKWRVDKAGTYRITFDLRNWTIAAEYVK